MVESDQDKQNRETEAEHGVAIPHVEDDGKMHLYSHSKSHVDPRAEVSLKSNIQLFIVICFLAGAFFLSQILEPEKERVVKNSGKRTLLVKTVNISPATQRVSFERTGTVIARNLIAITPQVSGRVVSVDSSFRSGSIFSANKTLFRIDGQDFQHQVDIAGAELATAEARLEVARAEHEASTDEWYSLNPGKEIPPLVARLPQLNEAKSAFSAAKARLSDAKLDLERSRYKLPYDGYVVESSIEEGQFVQSGQSYGEIYRVGSLEVIVPVEDRILSWLDKDESSVEIHMEFRGEKHVIAGTIKRISSVVDPVTRFANIIVEPDKEHIDKFVPGVFVDVLLVGKEENNILAIPNNALQSGDSLWIVTADNLLKRYQPDILSVRQDDVLARHEGIETIRIVDGLLKSAIDGMAVRLIEEQDNKDMPAAKDDSQPADSDEAGQ